MYVQRSIINETQIIIVQTVFDHYVGVDHLPYLFRALYDLVSRWKFFSTQLNVTGQSQIEKDGGTVEICFVLVLQRWLKGGKASWKTLMRVIARPTGGNYPVLAHEIANAYEGTYVYMNPHVSP